MNLRLRMRAAWIGRSSLVSATALLLLAAPAAAQDLFRHLDANEDEVLSGKEAALVKPLDADGDGEISRSEFDTAVAEHRRRLDRVDQALFTVRDGNEDGRLSGTELSGYEFTDLNGDKRVPLEEFLAGLRQQRGDLKKLNVDELREEAARRFKALDQNEDGRLSGTELADGTTFDLNGDRRVPADEFLTAMVLDTVTAVSEGSPPAPVPAPAPAPAPPSAPLTIDSAVTTVVEAVNGKSSTAMYAGFLPELRGLVDEPMLRYTLEHIARSHGKIALPRAKGIESSEVDGTVTASVPVQCARGKLTLRVGLTRGAISSFSFESPQVDQLNDRLFLDLQENSDGVLKRFAEFYSVPCQQMIRSVLAKQGDDAFAMIHPEIQQSIGREAFQGVFDYLLQGVGRDAAITLEAAAVELDANKKGEFLSVTHLVKGSAGTQAVTHKLQFIGLKAHFVGLSSKPFEATPTTTSAPAGVPAKGWKVVSSVEDGLRFSMPGDPTRSVDEGGHILYRLDTQTPSALYSVHILKFDDNIEGDPKGFFEGLDGSLPDSFQGKIVDTDPANWNGHPGRVTMMNLKDGRVMVRRDILVGKVVYAMQWLTSDTSKETQKSFGLPFIESFGAPEEKGSKLKPEPEAPPPPR